MWKVARGQRLPGVYLHGAQVLVRPLGPLRNVTALASLLHLLGSGATM